MKVYFYIIAITFFLTNCIPSIENGRFQYDEYIIIDSIKYHFPIRVENFDYVCVDTNFTIVGMTHSIPPHYIKKIKNFDFEILLKIRNESKDLDWNRPLYIEIDRLASDSDTLKLTRYGEVLYSDMFYNIPFRITVAEGERVLFRLGFVNKAGTAVILANPNDQYRTLDIFF